ncbi:hypothetical protein NDU88_008837 [Pleurodeles waltl]|uniref:Uncharacterized protein n=1 Tax=Pleurodeles waltl TaxID=8319 RepID=A0AAV7NX73_PLEWA|nr:hypothetical protein NDU88_008837 [Pleurodeles waltl]
MRLQRLRGNAAHRENHGGPSLPLNSRSPADRETRTRRTYKHEPEGLQPGIRSRPAGEAEPCLLEAAIDAPTMATRRPSRPRERRRSPPSPELLVPSRQRQRDPSRR